MHAKTRRHILVIACCAAVLAACGRPAPPPPTEAEAMHLHTEAGQRFEALLYRTDTPSPPSLLLVPGHARSKEIWAPLARRLQREGFLVISIELESGPEPLRMLERLHAAREALWEQGADPENFAIAGEELGANLALHYALAESAVQAAVLIAPGLEYHGVRSLEVVEQLDTLPLLVLAAEGDAYAASSAQAIEDTAPVYSELRTFSGAARGADLFTTAPMAMDQVLQWLNTVLNR